MRWRRRARTPTTWSIRGRGSPWPRTPGYANVRRRARRQSWPHDAALRPSGRERPQSGFPRRLRHRLRDAPAGRPGRRCHRGVRGAAARRLAVRPVHRQQGRPPRSWNAPPASSRCSPPSPRAGSEPGPPRGSPDGGSPGSAPPRPSPKPRSSRAGPPGPGPRSPCCCWSAERCWSWCRPRCVPSRRRPRSPSSPWWSWPGRAATSPSRTCAANPPGARGRGPGTGLAKYGAQGVTPTGLTLGDGTPVTLTVSAVYARGLGFGDLTLPHALVAAHVDNPLAAGVLFRRWTRAGRQQGCRPALGGRSPRQDGVATGRPADFQAWKPPVRSVARWRPRAWREAAARLEA